MVEDLEGEDFPVPHPTRGYAFVPCGEVAPVLGPRVILMLTDGRDIIVSETLGIFTASGGLVQANQLSPGASLAGGELEGTAADEGTTFDIPALRGVAFMVDGISVMG